MLEVYSLEQTVGTNVTVPLNNLTIQKGCTAVLSAPSTIQLNKCGVYMVSCNCSAEVSDDIGDISIQMTKNGLLQPQAQSTTTGETGDITTMSFVTLVQVNDSNSCRCCDSPTLIQFINTGVPAIYHNINVTVTKVC